jgi:hypothetical protein
MLNAFLIGIICNGIYIAIYASYTLWFFLFKQESYSCLSNNEIKLQTFVAAIMNWAIQN